MGSSGSSRNQKVFGKVKTTKKDKRKKKMKENNKEIGSNFLIDFLFFIPDEKYLYSLNKKWTDPRIGSS